MAEANKPFPSPETAAAITSVANTEPKALAYIGLVVCGEVTGDELGSRVAEHLGNTACKLVVKQYPENSFVPGGFAEAKQDIGKRSHLVNFYHAVEAKVALPAAGALLEWSETYQIALGSLLSSTVSPSGVGRAPVNTLQILDHLLRGIGDPYAMDLPGYRPHNRNPTPWAQRFDRLCNAGFIIKLPAEKGRHTEYELAPGYLGPIADLIRRVTQVDNDSRYAEHAAASALAIYYNVTRAGNLMRRGLEVSPYRQV